MTGRRKCADMKGYLLVTDGPLSDVLASERGGEMDGHLSILRTCSADVSRQTH